MNQLYIITIEIRDWHGHVEEWAVWAKSTAEALEEADAYGRVLSCRRVSVIIGKQE